MKSAMESSKTSPMFDTPFWDRATQRYDLMAESTPERQPKLFNVKTLISLQIKAALC